MRTGVEIRKELKRGDNLAKEQMKMDILDR